MESTERASGSACSHWFNNFSELSRPVKVLLAVFTAGIAYAAAKSLQGRNISWNNLGSFPVSKVVAGVAAGLALLGGCYWLGSRESAGVEKKTVKPKIEKGLPDVVFDRMLPDFLCKTVRDLKVPYVFKVSDKTLMCEELCALPESLIFFRDPGCDGIHLKLQMEQSLPASSSSKPEVISAVIYRDHSDSDRTIWRLYLSNEQVLNLLSSDRKFTTWDPSEAVFSNEKPEQFKDSLAMNLDQMLYAWLTGDSCIITNGSQNIRELCHWELSLLKAAPSSSERDFEVD